MLTRMSVSPPRTAFAWAFLVLLAACEPKATGEQRPPLAPVEKSSLEVKPAPPPVSAPTPVPDEAVAGSFEDTLDAELDQLLPGAA